jgi:pimeloyl-ACP methyl ester carboxylesterase
MKKIIAFVFSFFSFFTSFANPLLPFVFNNKMVSQQRSSEKILAGKVWIYSGQSEMNEKWVAVRYGFGNIAIQNLYTRDGFSVLPFRTNNLLVPASFLAASSSADSLIYSKWMGFKRTDFKLQGRNCLIVEPQNSVAGNPWIWRTEFFGNEPQADSTLAAKGFYVVYIDLQDMYGAPVALDLMDKFYKYLTKEKSLDKKAVLEGFSRGGLFAFNWAARHPNNVSCIYVDAPVCDFKSWPGGKGKSEGSPDDWKKLKNVYGFKNEKEAMDYKLNPIDNLEPLVNAGIPILCVCGETDVAVPMKENINIVAERYKKMKGKIEVISKPNNGHHPHSLTDPKPIVDFILRYTN